MSLPIRSASSPQTVQPIQSTGIVPVTAGVLQQPTPARVTASLIGRVTSRPIITIFTEETLHQLRGIKERNYLSEKNIPEKIETKIPECQQFIDDFLSFIHSIPFLTAQHKFDYDGIINAHFSSITPSKSHILINRILFCLIIEGGDFELKEVVEQLQQRISEYKNSFFLSCCTNFDHPLHQFIIKRLADPKIPLLRDDIRGEFESLVLICSDILLCDETISEGLARCHMIYSKMQSFRRTVPFKEITSQNLIKHHLTIDMRLRNVTEAAALCHTLLLTQTHKAPPIEEIKQDLILTRSFLEPLGLELRQEGHVNDSMALVCNLLTHQLVNCPTTDIKTLARGLIDLTLPPDDDGMRDVIVSLVFEENKIFDQQNPLYFAIRRYENLLDPGRIVPLNRLARNFYQFITRDIPLLPSIENAHEFAICRKVHLIYKYAQKNISAIFPNLRGQHEDLVFKWYKSLKELPDKLKTDFCAFDLELSIIVMLKHIRGLDTTYGPLKDFLRNPLRLSTPSEILKKVRDIAKEVANNMKRIQSTCIEFGDEGVAVRAKKWLNYGDLVYAYYFPIFAPASFLVYPTAPFDQTSPLYKAWWFTERAGTRSPHHSAIEFLAECKKDVDAINKEMEILYPLLPSDCGHAQSYLSKLRA